MIDRYTTREMRDLWNPARRTQRWLDVELAVCDALEHAGHIPAGTAAAIRKGARFDLQRMAELEQRTRHDVMAFVQNVMEGLGPEGRYLHFGVTSYDIVDTALALQLRDALDIILARVARLAETIRRRASEHKASVMIGRTHGVHAEPITFGFKLATWLDEMNRSAERLRRAREAISVGKIAGAVGTHANIEPDVEAHVCRQLGLTPAPVATQVVTRDRHAELVAAMAILAGSLERFATEIRNLARTELREVEERFSAGQKGSSAMPHKRNPWNCETISGLARVVRGQLIPVLESMATWHERDLSNSSVERIVLPDATTLTDWMVNKFEAILDTLVIYPETMRSNLERMGGLVYSEQVMLALIGSGLSREDAYNIVQAAAARAWAGEDFRAIVSADPAVTQRLAAPDLAAIFDIRHHLRSLDYTFEKLGI